MVKRRQLMTLTICLFNLTISRPIPDMRNWIALNSPPQGTHLTGCVPLCARVLQFALADKKNNKNNVYTGQPELTTTYTLRTPQAMFTVAQATKRAVRRLPSPSLRQDET